MVTYVYSLDKLIIVDRSDSLYTVCNLLSVPLISEKACRMVYEQCTYSSFFVTYHEVTHPTTNRYLRCITLEKANHSTDVAIKAGFYSETVEVIFIPISVTVCLEKAQNKTKKSRLRVM